MGWSWEDAAAGGAAGSSGFLTGNPLIGAATTVGGFFLGGLAGGGRRGDVRPQQRYQVDPGAGRIGGDMQTVYERPLTNDYILSQLFNENSGPLDDPELEAQRQRYIAEAQGRFTPESGITADRPGELTGDLSGVNGNPVGDYYSYLPDAASDPEFAAFLNDAAASSGMPGPKNVVTSPWADVTGKGDVATGNEIFFSGMNLPDRDAPVVTPNQEYRDVFGDSMSNLSGAINDTAAANADIKAQIEYLRAVQAGTAGESLAEQQSNRMLGEQTKALMAASRSGPGFNPAAQTASMRAGGGMMDAQRQQLAEMRAQEEIANREQLIGLLGMSREGAQGTANLFGEQGRMAGDMYGADTAVATENARLVMAARAGDDNARALLMNAGIDWRNAGYDLLGDQADNELERERIAAEAASNAANIGFRTDTYNTDRRDERTDRLIGAGGKLVGNAAIAGANYADNGANGGFGSNPGDNWQDPSSMYSDEATKKELESANDTISYLLEQLAGQSGGAVNPWGPMAAPRRTDIVNPWEPYGEAPRAVGRMPNQGSEVPVPNPWSEPTPDQKKLAADLEAAGSETVQGIEGAPVLTPEQQALYDGLDAEEKALLANLAGVDPQQWEYKDSVRKKNPKKAPPGRHVGYTTQQLERAGEAGKAMVTTDPKTGYDQLDPGAVASFSLGAVGDQERRVRELENRVFGAWGSSVKDYK